MGPLSDTELAYVAGMFDGEGCVFIQRVLKTSIKPKRTCEMYVLRVQLTNVDPRVIFPMKEMFGGSIHRTVHKSPNQRDTFVWIAMSDIALRFLKAVQPWLRAKADQAAIAVDFQGAKKGRRIGGRSQNSHQERLREREQYNEITALKYRTFDPADFGMVANSVDLRTGQYRAKQREANLRAGVCNEQMPPATAKMCSDLYGNIESEAEMTSPGRLTE